MQKTLAMKIKIMSLLFAIMYAGICMGNELNIKMEAKLWPDTSVILAKYYGGQILVVDTFNTNNKGKAELKIDSLLPSGIYTVYYPDKTASDILLDKNQQFQIVISGTNYANDITIKGSKESEAFQEYQSFMHHKQEQRKAVIDRYKENKDNADSVAVYKTIFSELDKGVNDNWDRITTTFPNTFLTFFINSLKPVNVPDSLNGESKEQQIARYNYVTSNYFEHLPLNDPRSLRTPQIETKIDDYMTKVVVQHPDTIIKRGLALVDASSSNNFTFQYVTQKMINYSTKSELMGMDKMFYEIATNYYLTGMATWADSTLLSKISDRVDHIKNNLIGKKAKELVMESTTEEFFSLHQVDAPFTIVYFWEPGCSHCQKITPLLQKDVYEKFKDKGLKIYAVYTQHNKEEWKEYINEHELYDWIHVYDPYNHSNFRFDYDITATPQIFILDKEKNIIAKKTSIETTVLILDRLFTTGKLY